MLCPTQLPRILYAKSPLLVSSILVLTRSNVLLKPQFAASSILQVSASSSQRSLSMLYLPKSI